MRPQFFATAGSMKIRLSGDRFFRIICAAFILFGVIARFSGITRKPLAYDEVCTYYYVSSLSPFGPMSAAIFDGRIYSVKDAVSDLLKPERRTLSGLLTALRDNNPSHVPLYFITAQTALNLFPGTIIALRLVSIIFGVLLIPVIWALSFLLFHKRDAAWLAAAIAAASPFFVVYSQDARPYSLWALFVALSWFFLIKASAGRSRKWWAFYTAATAAGLYTHWLHLLVCAAQLFYLLAAAISGRRRASGMLALAIALLLAAPAAVNVYQRTGLARSTLKWIFWPAAPQEYALRWVGRFACLISDFEPYPQQPAVICAVLTLIVLFVVLWIFIRTERGRRRTALAASIIFPEAILLCIDWSRGGVSGTVGRYTLPCFIGWTLVLGRVLAPSSSSAKKNLVSLLCCGAVFALSTFSTLTFVKADSWWYKPTGADAASAAKVLNRFEGRTLLLFPYGVGGDRILLISLLFQLRPQIFVQRVWDTVPENIYDFDRVFLLEPSSELILAAAQHVTLTRTDFDRLEELSANLNETAPNISKARGGS